MAQYPDVHSYDAAQLNSADPTPQKKYLAWMMRAASKKAETAEIIAAVKLFHRYNERLPNRDIMSYGWPIDIIDTVDRIDKISNTAKKKQMKLDGAVNIYEDDTWNLIRIDSREACLMYGKNTRWCITEKTPMHYNDYKSKNILFYFAIRKVPQNDKNDKIAIAIGKTEANDKIYGIYDVEDLQIGSGEITKIELDLVIRNALSDARQQPSTFESRIERGDFTIEEFKKILLQHKNKEDIWKLFYKIQNKFTPEIEADLAQIVDDKDIKDVLQDKTNTAEMVHGDLITWWDKNGKAHRDDGPAIIYVYGTKLWFNHGKKHRTDGPAMELVDPADPAGKKSFRWFIDGVEYFEGADFNSAVVEYRV